MPTAKNYDFIKSIEGDLAEIFITSSASVKTDAEAPTEAYKAENLAGVSITVSVPKERSAKDAGCTPKQQAATRKACATDVHQLLIY